MKNKIILSCLCLFSAFTINAQNWLTDIGVAEKIAIKENKKIVMVFQGSDWCAPCIKLDKYIWSTEEFKSYSNDNFVMVKVDFPRRKKNKLDKKQEEYNGNLAEKYNPQGIFPMVVVIDSNKKVLGRTGYKKMTPSEYIKLLSSF
ncbi:thioredoxin family protein [bacterium]|nr:thioredoxin family protein [bacterium]MDB4089150.1 thioredoxin family protein [Flavobacteriales bacterium]